MITTAAILLAILWIEETGSAFTSTTENNMNSFTSAASYLPGTERQRDGFSTDVASGWGGSWTAVTSAGVSTSVSGGQAIFVAGNSGTKSQSFATTSGDFNNQGIYLRHRFASTGGQQTFRIGVKCLDAVGNNAPTDCSWSEFTQATTNSGGFVATKTGQSGTGSGAGTVTVNDTNWWRYRIEIENNLIKMKRWADNATEPASWASTWSVPSNLQRSTGHALLENKNYSNTANLTSYVDDVYFYTF